MPKLCFAADATLTTALHHAGLPEGIILQPVDFAKPGGLDDPGLIFENAFCLGFIVAPAAAAALPPSRLALLPESLREGAVFSFAKGAEAALAAWCLQRLTLVLDHLLQGYTRSNLALAELRQRQTQLESALALAESAFADFRKEPLKRALCLEPSGVYARLPENVAPASLSLSQHVAVPVANVNYIDLFFNRDGTGLTGEGRFIAANAFSQHVICDHQFTFADIRQGWNRFACIPDHHAAKQPLSLTLELGAPGVLDLLPGLSSPWPVPDECAQIANAPATARPLAIRIWSGIAGIRYPRHATAIAARDATAHAEEIFSIPADSIAAAEPYHVARRDLDFAAVSYEEGTQSLLVHPLGRVVTVARLSGIAVRGLRAVSALCQLRRADAQPVDFALLALPAAGRQPRFADGNDQDTALLQSLNWLHLMGGEWGEARYELSDAITGHADIYLLTRNQSDDYNLCWAFFRGIQLTCAQ